jgi:hypothetical protein
LPSVADEAFIAHEEVREAAVVGVWGALRLGGLMAAVHIGHRRLVHWVVEQVLEG